MHCNATGYPQPRITWYKNDVPIQEDDRIRISGKLIVIDEAWNFFFFLIISSENIFFISESNELTISPTNSNDTADYRCEGVNQYSTSSESVNIRVDGI